MARKYSLRDYLKNPPETNDDWVSIGMYITTIPLDIYLKLYSKYLRTRLRCKMFIKRLKNG